MANTEWSRLRPIHDAAAALDGIADDATPDEIADAVTVALKRLSNGINMLEISDRAAARQMLQWKTINGDLRAVIAYYANQIAVRLLESNNGKSVPVIVEADNGEQIVCTPKVTFRRTDVNRQELTEAVERLTTNPVHRLNPNGTGELVDHDTAKLMLLKKAFRLEPRWSELKKLGIQDDEFCVRDKQFSLDVKAGMQL